MDVTEISDRFDSALRKNSGGLALNEYEKSLYLTKAQLAFVRKTIKAYEYTDELRHILAPLLVTVPLVDTDFTTIDNYYTTQITPNTIMTIAYEVTNGDLPTIPLDTNDIHYTLDNPFRKPDKNIAYRVTLADEEIRLYTSETLLKYLYIYCKYPDPIVLEDFTVTGLEVSGVSVPTTSLLSEDSVITIIGIAVDLAVADIKRLMPPPEEKTVQVQN